MPQALSGEYVIIDEREHFQDARRLAEFLDSKYQLPFGWRIGWDGLLGLIPGIGDLTTNILSFYILYKAALLGCTPSIILRMGLNILIDNVIDTVPLLGNIFDFMWKANNKNIVLIENFLQDPTRTTRSSRAIVFLTLAFIAAIIAGMIFLTFYLARWLLGVFQTAW
jgi:hypothetical protein